ncbi:hypothetical protein [Pelomicrobium methylotrophicum]|uniref:Uncharacterized protein n=1 Tax=Pelomicrobium methylotrophicum TaxID=2602750 RepID=A0A5C7EQE1_9PROT|nr:hypothetical protein [Pelomicrobium methylotrophicum]TXF10425.1 hypothetical protein FR698_15390 [Pelomicrobium methylotrophicum]
MAGSFTPDTVFAKTDKGRTEVATRQAGLDAKTRMLLIMLDGQTPLGQLAQKLTRLGDLGPCLEELLALELIAPVDGVHQGARPRAAPVAGKAPPDDKLEAARREALRRLHELLGPDADLFAPGLEAAGSVAGLLEQVQRVADVVRSVAGKGKAEEYVSQVRQRLG